MSVYLPCHGLMDGGPSEFTLKALREEGKKFTSPVCVYAFFFNMFSVKCVGGSEKGAEKGRIRATVADYPPSAFKGKGC